MNQTIDIPELQRQMSEIRGEMGHDMQTLVTNARTLSDWRYYVRKYPWACMGAAAFAGYLLVPPRIAMASPVHIAAPSSQHSQVQQEKAQKKGMVGVVLGMVMSAAMRGASTYATGLAKQYFQTGKLELPGFGGGSPPAREGRHYEEPHY